MSLPRVETLMMSYSDMVLIAPATLLPALRRQESLAAARVFTDADLGAALDAIIGDHPAVIAVERDFGLSPSGAAFIKRITSEAKRAHSDVQLVQRRRHPRFTVSRDTEVMIDGHGAMLIDVSVTGAQVLSSSPLRPNRQVRMSLPTWSSRLTATVVWSSFEVPGGRPEYRAGLEFEGNVLAAVNSLIEAMA